MEPYLKQLALSNFQRIDPFFFLKLENKGIEMKGPKEKFEK